MPFLRDIIEGAEQVWGDQSENIGNLVPTGIAQVDKSMLGVNIQGGEIWGIQGIPGSRKTTLVANLIVNQCLSRKLPPGYNICIDTLESGMTVERYAWVLLAIVATKFLVYWSYHSTSEENILRLLAMGLPGDIREVLDRTGYVESSGRFVRTAVLRPEFFYFINRTDIQARAITLAKNICMSWPIIIQGVSEHPDQDTALKRSVVTSDIFQSFDRWCQLYEEHGVRELIIDHLQEYLVPGADPGNPIQSHFEIMRQAVPKIASWQKQARGVVWIVSQIGTTSSRESRVSNVKAYAMGGMGLQAEVNVMWQVDYNEDEPHHIRLRRPIKSRKGIHPDLAIPIEPNSGAFLGQACEYQQLG